ncbi:N-acetyltransferase [Actinoplanes italicus]|uniref:Ribosomal protein S18 acetylase RimI-like enzyme n=1 Tax=Actinoplanes italicus TaxID=113567 RepID=A0A2T0KGA6_9ACTN|nr:GNAT family N-acetyltransferase [Actinoplanes italicus]PRX22208.1 ribosomal protein S18 acetylase RimI-like enzyme [Actinoplanes italicus]GIE29371.1 N-acetyltransferase [Actinoplanes italicus]
MPETVLRPAGATDGGVIARIQLEAWRATYGHLNPAMVEGLDLDKTSENWARAATGTTHRIRVAVSDGTVIGYAVSGPPESEEPEGTGVINAVYLLPSARGIGAGRLLVEDALAGLAASGCTACMLWVAEQNPHARGFYEHLGFRYDGGRDEWRGLPIVRYRRPLAAERPLAPL